MSKPPFKIYLSLRRCKTNADRATIQGRVSVNGQRCQPFSLGLAIHPDSWVRAKGRTKDRQDVNASLVEIETELTGIYHRLRSLGRVSAELVRKAYMAEAAPPPAAPLTFLDALHKFQAYQIGRTDLDASSKDKYQRHVDRFLEPALGALDLASLPADQVTRTHVDRIRMRLLEYGLSVAYLGKILGYLRTFCKWAHSYGHMAVDPMYGLVIHRGTPNPVHLTEEQQAQLLSAPLSDPAVAYARDMFIFQLELGLNYSDAKLARPEGIFISHGLKWLSIERGKSHDHEGQVLDQLVWLTPLAEQIAERYEWHINTMSNQDYNRKLKIVAGIAGVPISLTTRMARSTFSQNKLDEYSQEVVMRMTGHRNAQTLHRHYARASLKRVASEINGKLIPSA